MAVSYITPPTANGQIGIPTGLYRNPLPMSDGTLIAAYTPDNTAIAFGADTNTGTATLPISQYKFRLATLSKGSPYWITNQNLTAGIPKTAIYYEGA